MAYSFEQTYTTLDSNLLAAIFPNGDSDNVQDIIDATLLSNPNAEEKDILEALRDDANGTSPTISFSDVYRYTLAEISELNGSGDVVPSTSLTTDEHSVWQWINGAINVNSNDGSDFSDFIREYIAEQYSMRYGTTISGTAKRCHVLGFFYCHRNDISKP